MQLIKTVNNCRLCDNGDIPIIWDWGKIPLANAFKNKENLDKPEFTAPLKYFKCSKCHSVQLKEEVSSEILFKNYMYESPPNLTPHFKELAKTTCDFLSIENNSKIIDIGSNNGLLLQEYKNLGHRVVGFEPCDKIAQKARDKGIETFSEFFNGGSAEEFALQYKCPDLITCTNCFAHVSNLNDFVEGINILMGPKTYFVFENAYLYNTLWNKDFGQCYFEHFYLHSLMPLQKLFRKYGLELFYVTYNQVQMGSLRGYVKRKENLDIIPFNDTVADAIDREYYFGLDTIEPYKIFLEQIDYAKERLLDKLNQIKGSISVFGWPAKMTLLNKYFGLEPYIDYVVEEADSKIGKFAPGTKLEIKDVNYFKDNPTSHCILGAYNFANDIKKKNVWYNGEWINPLE